MIELRQRDEPLLGPRAAPLAQGARRPLIVMKFGGTSVAGVARMREVARIACERRDAGACSTFWIAVMTRSRCIIRNSTRCWARGTSVPSTGSGGGISGHGRPSAMASAWVAAAALMRPEPPPGYGAGARRGPCRLRRGRAMR